MGSGAMTEKYRPSNGTEGDSFIRRWCHNCSALNICKILPKTFALDRDDPEYPAQWTFDAEGSPVCTSFAEKSLHRFPRRCKRTADLFGGVA
jgi:hypothetical protein